MKVGVFLGNSIPQTAGGKFTFEENIISALLRVNTKHEFYVFYYGSWKKEKVNTVNFVSLSEPLDRLKNIFIFRNFLRLFRNSDSSLLQKSVMKYGIDVMWFLSHNYEKVQIPFITTVLDLEHKIHPFFPEVSITGTWENREQYFGTVIPKAAYVITGTEAGKREIIKFYHVDEERVKVLPFPTPKFTQVDSKEDIIRKYDISHPYLFYPAQFWPHKNHVGLLHALKIITEEYSLDFSLVFTGSDRGNLKYVQEKAADLGLTGKVYFLGFVSQDELVSLYKKAFAMVFASFFGPDNLPPIEAFALRCPVIASKVEGAEEQLGDAVILVDPKKAEDIALAVKKLYDDLSLGDTLRRRGLARFNKWTSEDYIDGIISIIDDFESYRRCWSSKEVYIHI